MHGQGQTAADLGCDLTASLLHFVNDASANLMLLLENGSGRTKKKVNHRRYLQKQLEQCRTAATAAAAAAAAPSAVAAAAASGGLGGRLSPPAATAAASDDNCEAPTVAAQFDERSGDGGWCCSGCGDCGGQCRAPSKARKASYSRRKARRSHPAAATGSVASWSPSSSPSAPSSLSSTPPQSRRSSLVETCGAAADFAAAAVANGAFCQLPSDFLWEPQLLQCGGKRGSGSSCSSVVAEECDRGLVADDSRDSVVLAEPVAGSSASPVPPSSTTQPHWPEVYDDPIAEFFSSHCAVEPPATQSPVTLACGLIEHEQQQQQQQPRRLSIASDVNAAAAAADAATLAVHHPDAVGRRFASCAVTSEASPQVAATAAAAAAVYQLHASYAQQPAFVVPSTPFYSSSAATMSSTEPGYSSSAVAGAATESSLFDYSNAAGYLPSWASQAEAAAAVSTPTYSRSAESYGDAELSEDDLMALSDLLDRLVDEPPAPLPGQPTQAIRAAVHAAEGPARWSSCNYYQQQQQQQQEQQQRYCYPTTTLTSPVPDVFASQQLQRQLLQTPSMSLLLQQQQYA